MSASAEPEAAAGLPPLSLKRNFSWTFAGNVVLSCCRWAVLMVLARIASKEAVGQWTLGLAVTAPILMLTNLQLRAVQATDATTRYSFGEYLALRLVMSLVGMLAVLVIVLTGGHSPQVALAVFVIGCSKIVSAMCEPFYGLLQQRERMDRIAVSMILKGPLTLAGMVLAFLPTKSVAWGAAGVLIAEAAVLATYDLHSVRLTLRAEGKHSDDPSAGSGLRPVWDWGRLWALTWLALPLGLVMMLISLNTNIPRYFIQHQLGEGELGIFGALAYLQVAGGTIMSALGGSASPRLAKYYSAGQGRAFLGLIVKLLGLAALLGGGSALFAAVLGKPFLTLIYGPEYGARTDVFVLAMVASAVSYLASVLGYGITAARYFRQQVPLFVLTALASLLFSYLFVAPYGLVGATYALICTGCVSFLGSGAMNLHALAALRRRGGEHSEA